MPFHLMWITVKLLCIHVYSGLKSDDSDPEDDSDSGDDPSEDSEDSRDVTHYCMIILHCIFQNNNTINIVI